MKKVGKGKAIGPPSIFGSGERLYDNVLRKGGHFVRVEALQNAHSAKTMRHRSGKVSITDGPFAESKEQIGGILLHNANDFTSRNRIGVETFGDPRSDLRDPSDEELSDVNTR